MKLRRLLLYIFNLSCVFSIYVLKNNFHKRKLLANLSDIILNRQLLLDHFNKTNSNREVLNRLNETNSNRKHILEHFNETTSNKTQLLDHFNETDYNKTSISKMKWACPNIRNLKDISCTCSITQSITCRGNSTGVALKNLIDELKKFKQNLSSLNLLLSGIKIIEADIFDGLSLKVLLISSGKLTKLMPTSFKGFENLLVLSLQENRLRKIPTDSIKILPNLRSLDFSTNTLKIVRTQDFPLLVHLKSLDLENNEIMKLQHDAFSKLPQLRTLLLGHNRLTSRTIDKTALSKLNFLSNLSLKYNNLDGPLTPLFLITSSRLKNLNLSNNHISKIAYGALETCKKLISLDLSFNNIDIIEDHAFIHLSKLTDLNLSNNQIVSLSTWSFAHLSSLMTLDVGYNYLFDVNLQLIENIPSIRNLNLAQNDITRIQNQVFDHARSLQHLNLTGNPLNCDCSIAWFHSWLKLAKIKIEDKNSFICATPRKLENFSVSELNYTKLGCENNVSKIEDKSDYYVKFSRVSEAEIRLNDLSWIGDEIQLVWKVDLKKTPYECLALNIYEMKKFEGNLHQIITEKLDVNCSSESLIIQSQIVITIPGNILESNGIYRYCLILIEKSIGDHQNFLPGCSDARLLIDPKKLTVPSNRTRVTNLTVGNSKMSLVVQTKITGDSDKNCYYDIYVITNSLISEQTRLNCSQIRHSFHAIQSGNYFVCVQPHEVKNNQINITEVTIKLKSSQNKIRILEKTFSACTQIQIQKDFKNSVTEPFIILLFTIPGIALILTLYVIIRNMGKGGKTWRSAFRGGKFNYFLYTGDSTSFDSLEGTENSSSRL